MKYPFFKKLLLILPVVLFFTSCNNDDDVAEVEPEVVNSKTYALGSVSDPGISGSAIISELDNGEVKIDLDLSGTLAGGEHPAHIHMNTAAEGGAIVITLEPVDGDTGMSSITIDSFDDGTDVSYGDLLNYDGYINVHLSATELSTLVAQGDIGQNELTGTSKSYDLGEKDVDDVEGTITFSERVNGEALAKITLENEPNIDEHPAHIHNNTAAEGGSIAFTFNPVNRVTGMSVTNVAALDDDTVFGYDDVLDFDGYVNVHFSAALLGTIIAQGDIGENELTGTSKTYNLGEKDVDGIEGTVTFSERFSGEALATINLVNTPMGGEHPAHIHNNSAVEGGSIAFTFNPVNGDTGLSVTNVSSLDDESDFGYDDVLGFDGYVNVHLSAEELETIVAQGDIGENELTGTSKTYDLGQKDVDGIEGTVTFSERLNGEALATISLMNTPAGGTHPAHIHNNTAAEGGSIAFSFNPVNGDTGMSMTNVSNLDDETDFGYDDVLEFDGYVNVHLSADELGTIVAQGDIGQNDLTGTTKTYNLNEKDVENIFGTVTFSERENGEALATLNIINTPAGGEHPAHIHNNSAAEGGSIAFTFTPVNGDTGTSVTNVASLDDDTAFGYSDVLGFNGYVNIHLSAEELATIVAQGNIGSNVED